MRFQQRVSEMQLLDREPWRHPPALKHITLYRFISCIPVSGPYPHRRPRGARMVGRYTAVAVLTLLAACVPAFVDRTDLASLSPEERTAALQVRLLNPDQPVPARAVFLADVEGFSCKHLLTDPPATRTAALQQLQVRTHRLGASAVTKCLLLRCRYGRTRYELLEFSVMRRHGYQTAGTALKWAVG
jgi:hypothetical protein